MTERTDQMAVSALKIQQLINDDARVSGDIRKIERYVKDNLFQRIIFMFDEGQMKKGSYLHRYFMSNCKAIVSSEDIGSNDDIIQTYLAFLWMMIARDRLYNKWLSTKRSNVSQAVQDKFQGEKQGIKFDFTPRHIW